MNLDEAAGLDAEIAEKVMGWRELEADSRLFYVKKCTTGKSELEYVAAIDWTPFTDISDAWMVVGKMREKGAPTFAIFCAAVKDAVWSKNGPPEPEVGAAPTDIECLLYWLDPEIICRAALEAVGSQS